MGTASSALREKVMLPERKHVELQINSEDAANGLTLDASRREITSISIAPFSHDPILLHLDLSKNYLIRIPQEICDIYSLVVLNLSDNRLTKLPQDVGRLDRLQKLHLCGNRLDCLPYDISSLSHLQRLSLERNRFTAIPDFLRALPQNRISVDRCLVEGPKSCCPKCPNKDGRMFVAARQTGFAVPDHFPGNEDVAYGSADELIIMNLSTLAGNCRHAFLYEDGESEISKDARWDRTESCGAATMSSDDSESSVGESVSCETVPQNYISIVQMLRNRECGQTFFNKRKLEWKINTSCSPGICDALKNKNLILDSFGYVADLAGQNDASNPHREPGMFRHEGDSGQASLKPSDSNQEESIAEISLQDHNAWLQANGTGKCVRHGVSNRWGQAEKINAQLATMCLRRRREIEKHTHRIYCSKYGRKGGVLLTASQCGKILVYDGFGSKLQKSIVCRALGWSVLDMDISHDERFCAYSSWTHNVQLCKLADSSHEELCLDLGFHAGIFQVQFNQCTSHLLAGVNHGYLIYQDIERKKKVLHIRAHVEDVNSTCFVDSQSDNLIASAADDNIIRIWDRRVHGGCSETEKPSPVACLSGHLSGITCVTSRGDGQTLLSNGKEGNMLLWDLRKAMGSSGCSRCPIVCCFAGHEVKTTLIRCGFSSTEGTGQRFVYSGSADGSTCIWDTQSGCRVAVLAGHRELVRECSWHPFLPQLVTSSWDGTVAVWEP
eukprot:767289-Hanusia_phi.AAC.1